MSMDAVAVVHVSLEEAKESLAEGESSQLIGADGTAFRVRPLADGMLVYTGLSLRDAEPEEIAATLRQRLGDVLDAHDDARGVMVFPERVRASGSRYEEVVEALGDLGEWIATSEPEGAGFEGSGPAPDLESLMSQMMGDSSQMQGLWQQAQRMMADPAMQQQLMAAAAQMMGGMPPGGAASDEEAPRGGGLPGLGGLDLGALAAQAQQLLEEDPDLVRRLQEQLGGDEDDEDDDD
jgi:hypothetical protein